jgi:hypothetical protein
LEDVVTEEIAKKLQEQLGFGEKQCEDGLYWKYLTANNIGLYFGDFENRGVMVIGIYAKGKVNTILIDNLTIEFYNCISNKYCDVPILEKDGNNYDIHADISLINASTVDWAVSAIGELERRANFTITG